VARTTIAAIYVGRRKPCCWEGYQIPTRESLCLPISYTTSFDYQYRYRRGCALCLPISYIISFVQQYHYHRYRPLYLSISHIMSFVQQYHYHRGCDLRYPFLISILATINILITGAVPCACPFLVSPDLHILFVGAVPCACPFLISSHSIVNNSRGSALCLPVSYITQPV
jgi:hypothetical protein